MHRWSWTGTAHQGVWLDFGPGSVDGWLGRLVDAETEPEPAGDAGLTGRELQVLALLARGRTNRDIGARLHISEKTAGRHVSNIFVKLDVHTRAEAARIATERGLAGAERPTASGRCAASRTGTGGVRCAASPSFH